MGIIESIGAVVEIAEGVERVVSKLNGDRTVLAEVWNHTDHTLRVTSTHHDHGGFIEPPSIEVPPQSVDIFGSQDKDWSVATGTEGRVKYAIGSLPAAATVAWDNPFIGSNECSGRVAGEMAFAFEVTRICGAGNDAHMKYELRQVRDPRFVRAPDYEWVRLEGYAYDPEHNWYSGQDPDTPTNPFPHRVLPLHAWWDGSREDNFATTDPAYTTPLRNTIPPRYRWHRLEGYVLHPEASGVPGTVPLYSWYSDSRADNFTTTDPLHTRPLRERIVPDYRVFRLEGHLFAPTSPQPPRTVPVHSWYSASRGDNFLTTDPGWRP